MSRVSRGMQETNAMTDSPNLSGTSRDIDDKAIENVQTKAKRKSSRFAKPRPASGRDDAARSGCAHPHVDMAERFDPESFSF